MFKNILNLQGVTVLSPKEKESINGGSQTCFINVFYFSGDVEVTFDGSYLDGPAGSEEANAICVDLVVTQGNGVSRCSYDCEWDN